MFPHAAYVVAESEQLLLGQRRPFGQTGGGGVGAKLCGGAVPMPLGIVKLLGILVHASCTLHARVQVSCARLWVWQ